MALLHLNSSYTVHGLQLMLLGQNNLLTELGTYKRFFCLIVFCYLHTYGRSDVS